MMASASSQAVVRRSTDSQLMPPPPPPKRIKRPQKVLDEDAYTDAISDIIRRDFFPGLVESETQKEYLDALESHDPAWISSAGRRLSQVMTPGRKRGRRGTSLRPVGAAPQTPKGYAGDTPLSVVSGTTSTTTRSRSSGSDAGPTTIDTNMSLDQFQSRYTSEDNESFYRLLDRQNQKRVDRHAWLWHGNALPSKRRLAQRKAEGKKLLGSRGSLVDGDDDKRLAVRDAPDEEKPAMPDSWAFKANNGLMYTPDGIEDSLESVAQRSAALSRAAPKAVVYDNTRLQPQPQPATATPAGTTDAPLAPPSPSLSAIRDAAASSADADADARRRRRVAYYAASSFNGGGSGTGAETPRVNGYAFVDDEPSPAELLGHGSPGAIDLVSGSRGGGGGGGDATPNPFRIRAQSRREDIHHRMVERTARSKRAAAVGRALDTTTPVPQFASSPRVGYGHGGGGGGITAGVTAGGGGGGLTPAAQRLWSRVGGGSRTTTTPVLDGKEGGGGIGRIVTPRTVTVTGSRQLSRLRKGATPGSSKT